MIVQPKQEFFQGTVASRNFDIDLSNDVNFGVAFDIISSGIYKDKPLAIVRELCSNAQDSHARAGTTRPFTVHVPTTIEPFWSVRDYGTGLAEHDVYRLLAGIFNSDKRTTNAEIGGFGLGSKTPFSYSDVYDITSWFAGTCYCFSAFRDGAGKPCVTLTTSYPSDEPNGVQISVPVKAADFRKFADATRQGLKFFFPKPEITGDDAVTFSYASILSAQDNWMAIEGANGFHLLMGPVAYPLDANLLRLDMNDETEARIHRFLTGAKGFVLNVPMGSIRVTASREDISYTQETIVAIKRIVIETIESVRSWIGAYLESIASPIDACMAYFRLSAVLGAQMLEAIEFSYEGIPLKPWFELDLEGVGEMGLEVRVPHMASRTAKPRLEAPSEQSINVRPSMVESNGRFEAPVFFYFNKLAGASMRYAQWRKSPAFTNLRRDHNRSSVMLIGTPEQVEVLAQSLGTTLDGGLFFNLDEIIIHRKPRASSSIDGIRVLKMDSVLNNHWLHQLDRAYWRAAEDLEDMRDKYYVLKVKGHHPIIGDDVCDYRVLDTFKTISAAMKAGLIEKRAIVGMKATEYRQFIKDKAAGEIGDEGTLFDEAWSAARADAKHIRRIVFAQLRKRAANAIFDWESDDLRNATQVYHRKRHLDFLMKSKSPIFADYQRSLKLALDTGEGIDLDGLARLLPARQYARINRVIAEQGCALENSRGRYSREVQALFDTNPVLRAYVDPSDSIAFFDALLSPQKP